MTTSDLERIHRYHEQTKHRLARYAPGPGALDWATQPDPFRRFAGSRQVRLALGADGLDTRYRDARAGMVKPARAIDITHIAILFELSLGLSAWKSAGGTRWALRCNPSSGNLHPTESYLACPRVPGLEGGIYHYLSLTHALEHRCVPTEPQWSASFPRAGIIIGLSSIHWREAWKYGARAYRYCQHDVGHALGALRYAAAALGWGTWLLPRWGDKDIARLLGLDREQDYKSAEVESPDVVLWVGPQRADPDANTISVTSARGRWHGSANRLSPRHVEWPHIAEVEQAARAPGAIATRPWTPPPRPALSAPSTRSRAATLFRQRRSAVAFDGRTAITATQFFRMLDALLPRRDTPPWDMLPERPAIHAIIFVHRVEGVSPGLYALARDPDAERILRHEVQTDWAWRSVANCPKHLPLWQILSADTREIAAMIACRQEIAGESCFSLAMLAEFEAALAAGPWRYRHLFWEAGVLGQTLYLEAEAAGVRGTGIGCYFDDEMHALLEMRGTTLQDLYHFTIGGPVEDIRLTTSLPYHHRPAT